jgi:hypothetical protein
MGRKRKTALQPEPERYKINIKLVLSVINYLHINNRISIGNPVGLTEPAAI